MGDLSRYGDLFAWAPALALLLVTALLSFSRIFERNPPALGLLLLVVLWAWVEATQGFVADAGLRMLLVYLKYVVLAWIPFAWVATCLRIVGNRPWGPVLLAALGALAVAFVVLLVWDHRTGWFFSSLEFTPSGIARRTGWLHTVYMTVLFGALGAGVALLVRAGRRFSWMDGRRAKLVLAAAALPSLAGVVDLVGWMPEPRMSLVPWALFASAVLFLGAILRGRLFAPGSSAYETVVRDMADPVLVLDTTGRPVWSNEAAHRAFPSLTTGAAFDLPEIEGQVPLLRQGHEVSVRYAEREYRAKGTPAQDQRSGFEALVVVFQDVTGLKAEQTRLEALVAQRTQELVRSKEQLEAELEKSRGAQKGLERLLSEKELLLHEVNHRVKNNLQIILSLINLQTRRLAQESAAKEILAATEGRIRSINLVHELIYRTEFGAGLDFRRYLEELVKGIGALYSQVDVRVEVLPSARPVQGGVDFSVDFGLVVNELVTNAFKHGIVPAGGGLVTVALDLRGSTLVLSVRDSGKGFVPDASEGHSLGLSLVRAVLKKYRAELVVKSEGGTLVEILIPWSDA